MEYELERIKVLNSHKKNYQKRVDKINLKINSLNTQKEVFTLAINTIEKMIKQK
jgi:hypothetical protein